ncbi:MAG TPA: DUF6323 family protein [Bacillota bacterium]|nr:DUF6323 family protein [Bacillota bacterium]
MSLLPSLLPLDQLSETAAITQIMRLNELSLRYGLTLSHSEALQLVQSRNDVLQAIGRIEVGSATLGKLISAFCDSAFINQQEYAEILHQLLEIFYYMKNETLDQISDDELIELMKYYYEIRCKGSLELLQGREMEQMARNIRYGVENFAELGESHCEDLDEPEEGEY